MNNSFSCGSVEAAAIASASLLSLIRFAGGASLNEDESESEARDSAEEEAIGIGSEREEEEACIKAAEEEEESIAELPARAA